MASTDSSLLILERSSSRSICEQNLSSLILISPADTELHSGDSTLIMVQTTSSTEVDTLIATPSKFDRVDLDIFTEDSEISACNEIPFHSTPRKRSRVSLELEDPLLPSIARAKLPAKDSPTSLVNDVSNILKSHCCNRRCLAHLNIVEVEEVRTTFRNKTRTEQKQFLLDSALMFTPSDSSNFISGLKSGHLLMLEGKQVCKQAFIKVVGISEKRYNNITLLHKGGVRKAKRKTHVRSEITKSSEAKTWMKHYFDLVGDRMPHIQRTHLPQFLTKRDVYLRMKREMIERGIEEEAVITLPTFYRFWHTDFRDVVIPKQSRFSKCDICTKFDQERVKTGGRCGFRDEYSSHLQRVEKERSKYYGHREKARSNPSKCITIIIDGMDQSKTNLPQLTQTPKSIQGLQQLRTHLTGVLVHTRAPHGKLAYVFIDMLQFPHDCNLTIHVLLNVLMEFKDMLPPVLNIQLDNTARENKNRFFLGFCSLLVEKKVFTKVRVNFLPVGHTHEDIDQLFSTVSKQLSQKGAETLPDLQEQISLSSTPSPKVTVVECLLDVRAWIAPSLDGLHGHSVPHCFKFIRGTEQSVLMFTRNWSNDPWCESEEASILLKEIPTGIPGKLSPSDSKIDLPRLKDDIPKYSKWLSKNAAAWWDKLDLETVYCIQSEKDIEWPLLDLQDGRELPVQVQQNPPSPNRDLQALFDAEKDTQCNVYTGAYRPTSRSTSDVLCVQDLSGITVGQLVAVHSDDHETEPWIGRVTCISDNELEVIWLEGGYTKKWKVAKRQDLQNKRKRSDWRDTIPRNSVILYDFELTTAGHLRKKTIQHLQKVYEQIRQENDQ